MPLVFIPDRSKFFLWNAERPPHELAAVTSRGSPATIDLVTPDKCARVAGTVLPLLDTVSSLALIPAADVPALPGSVAAWSLASKLALDLVSRERVVPIVVRRSGESFARWGAALAAPEDAAQVNALARWMPPAAHAVPAAGAAAREVWAPDATTARGLRFRRRMPSPSCSRGEARSGQIEGATGQHVVATIG